MKYYVGIDIGGTNIKGIVGDYDGNIVKKLEIPTKAELGRKEILYKLLQLINNLIDDNEISAIGIATAGCVNVDTGEVVSATDNLPGWTGVNLRKEVEEVFKIPTVVDNDANAALIGELWKGFRDVSSAVMLTLGTGVGGAVFANKNILRGHKHSAGELGHIVLYPGGRKCNCGRYGCIEQYLSGTALVKHANELGKKEYRHGTEIFNDFHKGDKAIELVVREFINNLYQVIDNIDNFINPQVIVIGGGVIHSKDIWWELIEEKINNSKVTALISPAKLGNMAGCIGALKLAIDYV